MILLVFVQLACLQAVPSEPAAQVPQEVLKRYDFLLKGMDDQRQRLRTGVYRASGRFISDHPELGRFEGPVTIFSAFDHDADKFRFERLEPIREMRYIPPDGGPAVVVPKKTQAGCLLRVKRRTTSFTDDSAVAASGTMTREAEQVIRPLDVRAFGLFYWTDLSSVPSSTYPQTLELLHEDNHPDEVVEERRGIWRVTWTFPPAETMSLRRTYWIDQNSGFSPIRTEMKFRTTSMPPDTWRETDEESESTWVEVSGVWVPRTYRIFSHRGQPKQEIYEFAFDWQVVNGEIPADVFSVKSLALPKDTLILDNSLGREFTAGSVGADHSVIDRTMSTPPPTSEAYPKRAWQGWVSAPYAFATLGCLALGFAAWLLFRSARKR